MKKSISSISCLFISLFSVLTFGINSFGQVSLGFKCNQEQYNLIINPQTTSQNLDYNALNSLIQSCSNSISEKEKSLSSLEDSENKDQLKTALSFAGSIATVLVQSSTKPGSVIHKSAQGFAALFLIATIFQGSSLLIDQNQIEKLQTELLNLKSLSNSLQDKIHDLQSFPNP